MFHDIAESTDAKRALSDGAIRKMAYPGLPGNLIINSPPNLKTTGLFLL